MGTYVANVEGWTISVSVWIDHTGTLMATGWFERDSDGTGGNLSFVTRGLVLELYEYSGTTYLPKAVADTLRSAGVVVTSEFD